MPLSLLKAAALACLCSTALCAPTASRQQQGVKKQFLQRRTGAYDPAPLPELDGDGPASGSGSLRGSPALAGYSSDNTVESPDTSIPTSDFQLAPGQSADSDLGFFLDFSDIENPQPIRGGTTAPTDPGPRNLAIDRENSDVFAPPGTDSGSVENPKWPMGLSHNRHGLQDAGWARQENIQQLPIATAMAGVDMRLEAYAYRELHWHQASEWSLILNGTVRVSAVNEQGETFIDDLQAGDVWFFPAGVPHSIQALAEGVEFLLVFDDGDFSEDNTFLVSELFLRNPKSVLAKDLRIDVSDLDNIPSDQLYIFPGTAPPANVSSQNITGPAGVIPQDRTHSYHWSEQAPYEVPGGSIKILDTLTFPIASDFAAALVTLQPGAMREIHWHIPNAMSGDEWDFFIAGQGRVTVFEAPDNSATFDFQAADVGYVPAPYSHYVENTGDVDLVYLEVLQSPVFNDVSAAQWLGLTPAQVVKEHLGLSDEVLAKLPKYKPYILPGSTNHTQTNFTSEAA